MLKLKIKDNICSTNRKGKDYKILPEKILKLFPKVVSELFLNDNINEITQKEFEIRYDESTNRILIPVRNEKKGTCRNSFKNKCKGISKQSQQVQYFYFISTISCAFWN